MIEPIFMFDSREDWFPVPVEESVALHGYYWDETTKQFLRVGRERPVQRLDFPSNMRQPDLPITGYRRTGFGGGLIWYQYWLWYLYNPKEYAGIGNHEGDWEFVQIGCGSGDIPILVTASQHKTGGKREHWKCERATDAPIIYVARDSHANYFTRQNDLEDIADGEGELVTTVEWREFGSWANWSGRWGNSTEQGKSPSSPARQGDRWHRPHLYHSSCR